MNSGRGGTSSGRTHDTGTGTFVGSGGVAQPASTSSNSHSLTA